jgi:uncharacterized protein YciI
MTLHWVVLTTTNVPWDAIAPRIEEHRAYQETLLACGVLLASGPFLDEDGKPSGDGASIVIAASRAEAEALAGDDPLVREGLRGVRVQRWRLNQVAPRSVIA